MDDVKVVKVTEVEHQPRAGVTRLTAFVALFILVLGLVVYVARYAGT